VGAREPPLATLRVNAYLCSSKGARPTGANVRIVRPFRYELAAYCRHLFGPRSTAVRALIFAQGRSGTTLLENLLCSSGHFTRNGEVLRGERLHILFPNAFLEGLARKRPHDNFICHVKPGHIDQDRQDVSARPIDLRRFLETLSSRGWRIIHLYREDKLRQYLSAEMGKARGSFHKFDDQPEEYRIIANRDQFAAGLAALIECDRRERAALASIPHVEVQYETDLESSGAHQVTVDRVLDYLGLERRPVATRLRKINYRPIAEIVENYDAFAAWSHELGAGAWLKRAVADPTTRPFERPGERGRPADDP
jgi:hypothetical protein